MEKNKNHRKIKIKIGTKYLSDAISKLPSNCLFDKGKVGCGGTSIAIECAVPYVIAVPFIPLINSKLSQYPNERYSGELFGVMGGVSEKDVEKYLAKVEEKRWTPKFMVTYDSLARLTEWVNPKEYNLLIDEFHILFTSYYFRKPAVQSVLENYSKYKEYCFMTASVLENEFLLEELRDIQKIEAVWEDETTKTIVSVLCMPSLKGSVKRLIEKHVDGSRAGNAYLFVNSVEFIQQMVKACNLDDSNTRVIYSLNNNTEVGIKKGSPNDESKKINFITSTAFEGADFYDENGITYIISDNSKPHTLADISTSVIQIAGRIRNTKYDDFLFHIYTPTKYNVEVNYNEFKKSIYESIAKTKRIVREINDLSKESKRHVSLAPNEIFVTREENNDDYKYDPNIPKLHLYNYKLTRCIYRSRSELSREYRKYGFNVELQNNKAEPIPRMDLVKGKSFKEVCEALEKCWDNNFLKYTMLAAAQEKHPFINEAIHKLGFDGIKECSFIKQRVESKLISISHIGLEAKIADMFLKLNPAGTGDFISSFKAKKLLGVIYKELNIDKKPKSSQLNLCFDLKTDVIKDEKGKSVKGFRFLSEKALYSKVG